MMSHPHVHSPLFHGGGKESLDNVRICKTVLKEKISEIISQSFTSPVGSVNLSAVLGL